MSESDPAEQFTFRLDELPENLPVFPLAGVMLLPRGHLPLHIFENRYVAMIEATLKSDSRMLGMIQPRDLAFGDPSKDDTPLYDTGCAGRITTFEEIPGGRFLITLTGVCRFRVKEELPLQQGYRRVQPDFKCFESDLVPTDSLGFDRKKLKSLLDDYFRVEGLSCDWGVIEGAPDEKLITCLSMICPLDAGEKQALLEAPCGKTRAALFMTMLEMAVHGKKTPECASGCH